MNKIKASKIRKEICSLKAKRDCLEDLALRHRVMINACLIERFLGTKKKKRSTPAYYFSRKIAGKTQLIYIPREEVGKLKKRTDEWREYALLMKRINLLSQRIIDLFRRLGKVQVDRSWEK
ncbi:hypothetical protein ES705_09055 [subsurface metagenome]|jgi:hypothetical protein